MNGRQAQFSISFSIAVAVLEGNASFHQFTDEKVMDSRVRSMMGKVIVEVDKTMDKEYPKKRGAHGKMILTDGRQFSSHLDIPYGEPEFPVSVQEIEGKFSLLTQDILGNRAEEIRDQVRDLERLKDMSELIQKLGL
jgi:2-methylcitrate dehydratase PrpD